MKGRIKEGTFCLKTFRIQEGYHCHLLLCASLSFLVIQRVKFVTDTNSKCCRRIHLFFSVVLLLFYFLDFT